MFRDGQNLPAVSRAARRGIIEACLREPLEPGSNGKTALCYVLSSGSIEPQRLFAAPSLSAPRSATWIRRDRLSLQNAALEFAYLIDCFVARGGRPAFQPATSCGAMNCSAPNARNRESRRLRKGNEPAARRGRTKICRVLGRVSSSMTFLDPLMRLCHGPRGKKCQEHSAHIRGH
jgi:hypothetical protein